ncbi:MAG: hypothetical protein U5N58_01765 [Actinomycetota bacterium]|nr:hypothetical protein [Actinomycetota bacterium]
MVDEEAAVAVEILSKTATGGSAAAKTRLRSGRRQQTHPVYMKAEAVPSKRTRIRLTRMPRTWQKNTLTKKRKMRI